MLNWRKFIPCHNIQVYSTSILINNNDSHKLTIKCSWYKTFPPIESRDKTLGGNINSYIASYYRQLSEDINIKNYKKIKTSFISFILIFVEHCLCYHAIHNFSAWLRTSLNPADINRF